MRILLVNKYFYRKGGAETYFFALAEGLRALGHEVAFFSMQHPNNEPSYWSKYFVSEKDYVGKISAFQKVKEAATLVYSFEAKRKFEALLEDFKPDVIHMNNVHRSAYRCRFWNAPSFKKSPCAMWLYLRTITSCCARHTRWWMVTAKSVMTALTVGSSTR